MKKKRTMSDNFLIDGGIYTGIIMEHDDFLDIFIEFIESKGWEFCGVTQPDLGDNEEDG